VSAGGEKEKVAGIDQVNAEGKGDFATGRWKGVVPFAWGAGMEEKKLH